MRLAAQRRLQPRASFIVERDKPVDVQSQLPQMAQVFQFSAGEMHWLCHRPGKSPLSRERRRRKLAGWRNSQGRARRQAVGGRRVACFFRSSCIIRSRGVDPRLCNCAIMGNNWVAKLSLARKTFTRFKTCSATSIATESMMIGASGMNRVNFMATSCPFISGTR